MWRRRFTSGVYFPQVPGLFAARPHDHQFTLGNGIKDLDVWVFFKAASPARRLLQHGFRTDGTSTFQSEIGILEPVRAVFIKLARIGVQDCCVAGWVSNPVGTRWLG